MKTLVVTYQIKFENQKDFDAAVTTLNEEKDTGKPFKWTLDGKYFPANIRLILDEPFYINMLDYVSTLHDKVRSYEPIVNKVSLLSPRWDHSGEFYKPSDVTPVKNAAQVALKTHMK